MLSLKSSTLFHELYKMNNYEQIIRRRASPSSLQPHFLLHLPPPLPPLCLLPKTQWNVKDVLYYVNRQKGSNIAKKKKKNHKDYHKLCSLFKRVKAGSICGVHLENTLNWDTLCAVLWRNCSSNAHLSAQTLNLDIASVIWVQDLIHLHCWASNSSTDKLLKYRPLLHCQLSTLYQRPFVTLILSSFV